MREQQVRDGQDAAQAQRDKNSSSRMAVGWLCVFGVQNNVRSRYEKYILWCRAWVKSWPRTKTGQSDEKQVTNPVA
jgi:hypothetical protein